MKRAHGLLDFAWLVLAHVVVGTLGLVVLAVFVRGIYRGDPAAVGVVGAVLLVAACVRVASHWMRL